MSDRRLGAEDRREEPEANKLVWWLLGIVTAAAISLLTAWGRGVSIRLDNQQVIEQSIDIRLTRIETKLDRSLEDKK